MAHLKGIFDSGIKEEKIKQSLYEKYFNVLTQQFKIYTPDDFKKLFGSVPDDKLPISLFKYKIAKYKLECLKGIEGGSHSQKLDVNLFNALKRVIINRHSDKETVIYNKDKLKKDILKSSTFVDSFKFTVDRYKNIKNYNLSRGYSNLIITEYSNGFKILRSYKDSGIFISFDNVAEICFKNIFKGFLLINSRKYILKF